MIVSQNWHVKLAELRKPTSLKESQQFHGHEKIDQFLQTLSRFFCSDTAFGPMLFLFMEIGSAVPEKQKILLALASTRYRKQQHSNYMESWKISRNYPVAWNSPSSFSQRKSHHAKRCGGSTPIRGPPRGPRWSPMAALICRPSADALSTDEFDLYCELFKLCWRGDFPWRIDSY